MTLPGGNQNPESDNEAGSVGSDKEPMPTLESLEPSEVTNG